MIDKIDIENGKYSIVLEDSYALNIYRDGKPWINDPEASKVWIAVIYEMQKKYTKIKELENQIMMMARELTK